MRLEIRQPSWNTSKGKTLEKKQKKKRRRIFFSVRLWNLGEIRLPACLPACLAYHQGKHARKKKGNCGTRRFPVGFEFVRYDTWCSAGCVAHLPYPYGKKGLKRSEWRDHEHRQTDRQTERQRDRETDRQAGASSVFRSRDTPACLVGTPSKERRDVYML